MNIPVKTRPPAQAEPAGLQPAPAGPGYGPDDETPIDLRALLNPVWRGKWLILCCMLAAMALGVLFALNMQNSYTASARVIFDPERLRIIDLDNVVVSPDISTTGLQNQVEILRSATLLERVIDVVRLESTPEFNPALRTGPDPMLDRVAARLPVPERVRSLLVTFGVLSPPRIEYATAEEAAEALRAGTLTTLISTMRLRPIPNSRVIEISYSSPNPRLAASIVNAVAEQYILVQIEAKRDDVTAASELLSVRVQDLENRLNSAEEAVRLGQLELTMASEYGSAMIARQLEVLNTNLAAARLERSELESRVARLTDAVENQRDYNVIQEFRTSPLISTYRARETDLLDQDASLRSIVGERNPALTRIEARLAEVRRNIQLEAENIVAALTAELASAREREAALEDDLREVEARALEQSRAEMRLGRLEREAQAARTLYENFLGRLQETREQASLQTSDARFLTRATTPQRPDTTSRRNIVLIAAVGGIALGVGIVFLLEMLNSTFRAPSQLETLTGLPVLAAVPRAGARRRPKQLVAHLLKQPNSALAESVRNLRTSILFSNIDKPPKVIMFSSSVPGEGKTTTAMLGAITSQQMGRSAVVVDCDLRRGTLANMFAEEGDRPGLFALLEGSTSIEEAVRQEPETGLHILAAEEGGSRSNPADILASKRFQRLIEQLKARYDVVFLDTPPALVVTDARILAQLADAVVYLVRWDHTRRSAVLEGIKELASVGAKIAGVAFTQVNESRAAKYNENDYYYKRTYKKYISA
jgi:polysaccharide biosynthesis transport protein